GGERGGGGRLSRPHPASATKADPAVSAEPGEQWPDFHARMDFVDDRDVDGGVGSQYPPLRRIAPQAVENRQRVRGDERPHPLDDVAVVVVVRRLDQNELEAPLWLRQCTHHADKSRSPPTSQRCIHQSKQL